MADQDIDNDGDDVVHDDPTANAAPKRKNAAKVLGAMAMEAVLGRKGRPAILGRPGIVIVKVPALEWTSLIGDAVKAINSAAVIRPITELVRKGGVDYRTGASELGWVQQGRTLVMVSQDPDRFIDEKVLAAADLFIAVPALTPALLRQLIRTVTGRIARGVTAEMAQLDLSVILGLVRPELTPRQCVASMQRALDRRPVRPTLIGPLLSELPLTETVRAWSDQILADLAAVQAGRLPPDQLVFCVLGGPPGTGKTLVAEALARSAGWRFVPSIVGDWFTSGDGALGGVARNLKAFIDELLLGDPVIGFMDELDALPDRASMDARSREWWTAIITLFLVEVDRLKKSGKPIMLVGASNYIGRLDAALVRPGRLQQLVSVLPPQNDKEVLQLLRHYLKSDLADADLEKLVGLARGATPASIEGWTKQARSFARAQGRSLNLGDVIEQMAPADTRPPPDVKAIALHEVGHAVVAARLGMTVDSVSIIPEGGAGGHTLTQRLSTIPPGRSSPIWW